MWLGLFPTGTAFDWSLDLCLCSIGRYLTDTSWNSDTGYPSRLEPSVPADWKQSLLCYKAERQHTWARGETLTRSHLMIEGCNGYVTGRCHMMLCEYEALSWGQESSLTARCSVTNCQYSACAPPSSYPNPQPPTHTHTHPGAFQTLPAANTFFFTFWPSLRICTLFWLNYSTSFQTEIFLPTIWFLFGYFD